MVAGDEGYKGLKTIVVMDNVSEQDLIKAERIGVTLYSFTDVEENGYVSLDRGLRLTCYVARRLLLMPHTPNPTI